MAPSFSKPQHLQQASRLCRLPPEIRLIILRQLLVFPDCTQANDEAKDKSFEAYRAAHRHQSPFTQSIQLPLDQQVGTQIEASVVSGRLPVIRFRIRSGWNLAQTCQLFCVEGSYILYEENTLNLQISNTPTIVSSLPGLLGSLMFDTDQPQYTGEVQVVMSHDNSWARFPWHYDHESNRLITDSAYHLHHIFQRFRHHKITLGGLRSYPVVASKQNEWRGLDREFARVCRTFRDTLSPTNHLDLALSEGWPALLDTGSPERMYGCKILRCASLIMQVAGEMDEAFRQQDDQMGGGLLGGLGEITTLSKDAS